MSWEHLQRYNCWNTIRKKLVSHIMGENYAKTIILIHLYKANKLKLLMFLTTVTYSVCCYSVGTSLSG